jgi:hypothetical protein
VATRGGGGEGPADYSSPLEPAPQKKGKKRCSVAKWCAVFYADMLAMTILLMEFQKYS